MIQMKACVLGCICLCIVPMHAQRATVPKHGFSVKDSIEMTIFSDPYTRNPSETCKRSPDGKHFLVITTRGVLRSNRLESSLWIYSKAEVERYLNRTSSTKPRPRLLLRVAEIPKALQNNSYGSLITAAQWSSNSKSILALVEIGDGHRHVLRVALFGRKPVDLTPGGAVDVESFSEASGTIAYLVRAHASVNGKRSIQTSASRTSAVLTGSTLLHILFPSQYPYPSSFDDPLVVRVRYKGRSWTVETTPGEYFPAGAAAVFRIALSPDGRALIAARPVPEVSASWSAYQAASNTARFEPPSESVDRSGKDFTWPWEYSYVDLNTRSSHSLVDAPTDRTTGFQDVFEASWSRSGKEVLFTSSYLPLPRHGPTRSAGPVKPCAAGIYSVPYGTVSCLAYARFPERGEYLISAYFRGSDNEIALRWLHDGAATTDVYEHRGAQWVLKAKEQAQRAKNEITLSLHQDIDEPASLWATDKGKKAKLLWNPNPDLASVALGSARVYRWRDKSGYDWRGGLVLPPHYTPCHRYPLVIQTHGFYNDHEFLVDGSFTTGFAAQPLAEAGIIVLQMEDREDRHIRPASEEATMSVVGIEAAMDQLNKDGLIDPSRVGIIGFSRTHWYVEEALIHDPHRYRAATLIDGVDQSYVTDILFAPGDPLAAREQEAANGGMPFGPNLKHWVRTAAGFNLDKVRAAVRIEAIGRPSILGEWETYSSLRQQGKPVDFISIPDGQHILQKPQERFASQQGNVDWFRFWLQGYVDPNPAKQRQYQRWMKLQQGNGADGGPATNPGR
jgi:dipeptidyl aminopeptidase/acylaminoacyl peptidase